MSISYDSLRHGYANAIRVMRLLQARFRVGMTRGDVAAMLRDEFGCSRATSYRHAAAAIDTMGLDISDDPAAQQAAGLRRTQQRNGAVFHGRA